MMVAPPGKKSRAVFWITAIIIGSAILATVLLANDMRNLKILAHRYQVTWFDRPKFDPQEKAAMDKPVLPVKTRDQPAEMHLPEHIFDMGPEQLMASFARTWRISGDALCAKLTEAGLPAEKWHQSGFDKGTFECSHETQGAAGSSSAEAASFFIIVRGTLSGDISNVRMKAIMPDTDGGRAIRTKLIEIAAMLIRESQWSDFSASLDPIGRLENVTQSAFGAKLTFFHDFDSNQRFNFILELERQSPQQRRTADFFDAMKWLPAPPPMPAR